MTHRLPTFPVEGGCACGQVRYRLKACPPFVYTCHCTDCQTLTTSAFTTSATIPEEDLEVVSGSIRTWPRTTTETGIPQIAHVCENCGVRVFSKTSKTPGKLTLRVGTLDDTSWLNPVVALWMRSAQPWVRLPETIAQYDKGDADWPAAAKAWRAQFED